MYIGTKQVRYFPVIICPIIFEIAVNGEHRSNVLEAFFSAENDGGLRS